METPRILLYIGVILILISIFWTIIVESRKESVINELIRKGMPTPAYANSFQLQNILHSNNKIL